MRESFLGTFGEVFFIRKEKQIMKWSLFLPLEVYLAPITPGSPLTSTWGNNLSRKPATLAFYCYVTKYHKLTVGCSDSKESACNAGDPGSIPRSGRSPGEGNGNPLQYSRLENPMDRGAWWGQTFQWVYSTSQMLELWQRKVRSLAEGNTAVYAWTGGHPTAGLMYKPS